MRYETSVTVEAPARAVWDVLVDVERWPDWTESMTSVERLDDGPLKVGSTARITQPKMRPAVWTVTELEPGRSFTWESTNPGVRVTAGHLLGEEGGVTTAALSVQMSGPLGALAGALMGSRVRGYVRMEAEGLKARGERAPAS
ncbi:MAG: SRPBCC family protein [Streptosporangiales bacterium]